MITFLSIVMTMGYYFLKQKTVESIVIVKTSIRLVYDNPIVWVTYWYTLLLSPTKTETMSTIFIVCLEGLYFFSGKEARTKL